MWTEAFVPGLAPGWIRDFEADPAAALDELLTDAYYRGADNVLEPGEALFEWSLSLDEYPDFLQTLDAELADWLRNAPGGDDLAESRRGWANACQLVASLGGLHLAARVIRERFRSPQALLEDFGVDAADDLYDATIGALVESQEDRSLEPLWWTLVHLRGHSTVDRGLRGILGLDAMPPADADDDRAGLRNEIVDALLAYGAALGARIDDRRLSEKRAAEAMSDCVPLLRSSYPFPKRWAQALAARAFDPRTARWLRAAGLEWPASNTPAQAPRWGEIEELGRELRDEAKQALGAGDLKLALERSEAALQWDPFSPYSWSIRTTVIARTGGAEVALRIAWIARDRFPEDAACWHQLGTYLEEVGRLRLAEEIRWQAFERFPDNERSVNSLGKLLSLRGDHRRAARVLEPYVARHPDRIQPAVTLGDVYRLSGRIAEAEEIFRPLVDQKSTNSYVWSGWIRVLRDSNRQAEAEQMRTTACKRFPDVQYFRAPMTADPQVPVDVDAVTERKLSSPELAILRRRTVRLGSEGSDASAERAWLDERIEAADLAPITKQVERSLLALDDGRPQSALDRLTTARADLGETIPLLYALARAEREQASADGTRFSTAGFRRAMEPLAALRMRTAAARPLATLSAVRLAYAMNDGPPLDERREQSVETLRSELAAGRVSDSAFDRWWSSLVGSQILRGPMAADGDVGELLGASQRILNELEEDAVTKIGCEGAAW